MVDVKLSTIGISLLALLLGGGGAMILDSKYQTPSYLTCRVGNAYGIWIAENKYQFTCNLTNITSICWKTTITRCYLADEELLLNDLLEQQKPSPIVNINKKYVCSPEPNYGCAEILN